MNSLRSKKSQSSNSDSLKAAGKIHDALELLDDHELPNNELHVQIMEEKMKLKVLSSISKLWRAVTRPFRSGDSSKGSSNSLHGRVFIHDSVVVKFDVCKWIKAEKDGVPEPGKDVGGIKLVTVEDSKAPEMWQDPGDKGPGRYHVRFSCVINVGEGKEKWSVKKLRQLLSSVTPHYHFTSYNCWGYAHSSVKGILEWAVENTQSEPAREALKEKLKELEELERPRPTDVFRAVLKPSHARSIEVLEKFDKKLTHTCAHLPKSSTKRLVIVKSLSRFLRLISRTTPNLHNPRLQQRLTGG